MAEIKRIRKTQIPMVERWKTDKFNWEIKLSPEKLKKVRECVARMQKRIEELEKQKNGGSKSNNS